MIVLWIHFAALCCIVIIIATVWNLPMRGSVPNLSTVVPVCYYYLVVLYYSCTRTRPSSARRISSLKVESERSRYQWERLVFSSSQEPVMTEVTVAGLWGSSTCCTWNQSVLYDVKRSTVPTGICTAVLNTVLKVPVPETLEYYSCTIGLLHVRLHVRLI